MAKGFSLAGSLPKAMKAPPKASAVCWKERPSSITTASPPAPAIPETSSCISTDLPDPDLPVTATL